MNLAVDGMFHFGVAESAARVRLGDVPRAERAGDLLGHFGRFTAIDRPHAVEHTWMSEYTHGIETTVRSRSSSARAARS